MPLVSREEASEMGIPSRTLQTIEFPRETFTILAAKQWLHEHNYANAYYRITHGYIRFMQTPPIFTATYYSKKLSNRVILVWQNYHPMPISSKENS
jgi:hypothetical protein